MKYIVIILLWILCTVWALIYWFLLLVWNLKPKSVYDYWDDMMFEIDYKFNRPKP